MKNLTNIKQRISYFIENQRIGITEFYRNSGVTYGILTQKSNISEDNLVKFLTRYPEVNPEWLLTGKGEMLRHPTDTEPLIQTGNNVVNGKNNVVDSHVDVANGSAKELEKEVAYLKSQLEAKEQIIAAKDKIIALLEGAKNKNAF